MTDRGDDIEFDFFDEPETREDARRPRQQKKPSGGGPRTPARPPHGFTPLLRLVGLIAFAILIVVLLVLWVQSCQGAQKHDRYSNYMGKVSTIAHDSDQNGKKFTALMTTPGTKLADIVAGLNGLAQLQQQNVASAEQLRPPGTLRAENTSMVQALQLTVYGLRGLADAFRQTSGFKVDQAAQAGTLLATQAQRLTASDVVWADFFHSPSVAVLKQEGIGGVVVPESNFVLNPTSRARASRPRSSCASTAPRPAALPAACTGPGSSPPSRCRRTSSSRPRPRTRSSPPPTSPSR